MVQQFENCALCGDELATGLDRDTGVCRACMDAGPDRSVFRVTFSHMAGDPPEWRSHVEVVAEENEDSAIRRAFDQADLPGYSDADAKRIREP